MSEDRPTAQLSVIAKRAGVSGARVYEMFRLPGAPSPVEFVACMPVYDIAEAVAYVTAGRSKRSNRAV